MSNPTIPEEDLARMTELSKHKDNQDCWHPQYGTLSCDKCQRLRSLLHTYVDVLLAAVREREREPILTAKELALLNAGQLVSAVQAVRTRTKLGLKESYELVKQAQVTLLKGGEG